MICPAGYQHRLNCTAHVLRILIITFIANVMQLHTTPVVRININHLELDKEDSFGDTAFRRFADIFLKAI